MKLQLFTVLEIRNIPGHIFGKHPLTSLSSPGQSAPSCFGSLHSLVLYWVPFSHVTEQSDQGDQAAQNPSTAIQITKINHGSAIIFIDRAVYFLAFFKNITFFLDLYKVNKIVLVVSIFPKITEQIIIIYAYQELFLNIFNWVISLCPLYCPIIVKWRSWCLTKRK